MNSLSPHRCIIPILTFLLTAALPAGTYAQESFPTDCSTSPSNATIVVNASASQSVTDAVSLSHGDPIVAVTPVENNCAGDSALDTGTNATLAVAEADATTSTPGYEAGDPFTLWAQSGSGEIYVLTPTFAECTSDSSPLCADGPNYQPDMIYEVIDFSVSVLPVELVSWTATVDGASVVLEWATASETDNAGFDVLMKQRSATETESGGSWRNLAFVDGAGTTTTLQSYRYVTSSMRHGEYSFRLRQVDVDGTPTFTDPIRVQIGQAGTLQLSSVAPHPVVDQSSFALTLDASKDVTVALYNLIGQRVSVLHEGTVPAGRPLPLSIDAASLSSGQYLLRISGTGISETQPVTVVR